MPLTLRTANPVEPDAAPDNSPVHHEWRNFLPAWQGLAVIFIPALAVLFFCFYHLGAKSLGSGDESLYALATQGTMQSDHWWKPMWNGKPYFMTAPLKLWLNMLVIAVVGESNFAFRFVDAVSGCGTFLLTWLVAVSMFRDRRVGAVAIAALLGCRGYMFLHGPRQAVLDSPLLFFTTLAMFCAWQLGRENPLLNGALLHPSATASSRGLRWAALGGAALGLGFMTKSVAIVPPLAIAGLFALCRGRVVHVLSNRWREILLCLVIAAAIAMPYYVGHCLYSEGACTSLVSANVVNRVTTGYINTTLPFFYLRLIFVKRYLVPPELLVLALAFAAVRVRRQEFTFLLLWLLLPLVVYSIIPSRLPWYIASCYPAMALLCGELVVSLFDTVRDALANRKVMRRSTFAGLCVCLIIGVGGLGAHLVRTTAQLMQPPIRVPIDIAAEQVLKAIPKREPGSLVFHDVFDLPYREMPYRNMLLRYGVREDDPQRFQQLLRTSSPRLAIVPATEAPFVAQAKPIRSYLTIDPSAGRSWPILVASWDEKPPTKRFRPAESAIFLFNGRENLLFGWDDVGEFVSIQYRWTRGSSSGLAIDVDPAMAALGIRIVPQLNASEPVRITAQIGPVKLSTVDVDGADFLYLDYSVPGGSLTAGKNPFMLSLERPDGRPIEENERLLMVSSVRVELVQPRR